MSEPISFVSASPRYGLPNLFSGQAQKEFYINEAHARTDALLHPAVMGESETPPASPADGETWLIGQSPSSDWTGHAGSLASWQAGQWLFVEPSIGLRVQDNSTGGMLYFNGSWQRFDAPVSPSGGNTVDTEARMAIVSLIETLREAGIFSAN